MLEKWLTTLFKEMNWGQPPLLEPLFEAAIPQGTGPLREPSTERGTTVELRLPFSSPLSLQCSQREKGISFVAPIAPLPQKERETFLLKAMSANFLGQGTGGAVLGLKADETFLTLSLEMESDVSYPAFKETLEEFVNYLEYWKIEATQHDLKTEAS